MAHSTNYINTLIRPSPDCRAEAAMIPTKEGGVAQRQFDLMMAAPYKLTNDDVLITVHADRKAMSDHERTAYQAAFHAKGQPCMRLSPLVKTHGWAIHHNSDAHVSLIDPQSVAYVELMQDDSVSKIDGMRNARKST